jgi:hypothetical protein
VFEAVAAVAARRPACDLYHSALEVSVAARRFVIEHPNRYEIRRWRDGRIPDIDEAVGGPTHLSDDEV